MTDPVFNYSQLSVSHMVQLKSLSHRISVVFIIRRKPQHSGLSIFVSAEQKRVVSAVIFLTSPLPGTVLHWADTSPSPLTPPSWPAAPGLCQGAQFGPLLLTSSFCCCIALLEPSTSKPYSDTSINRCSSLNHYYIY